MPPFVLRGRRDRDRLRPAASACRRMLRRIAGIRATDVAPTFSRSRTLLPALRRTGYGDLRLRHPQPGCPAPGSAALAAPGSVHPTNPRSDRSNCRSCRSTLVVCPIVDDGDQQDRYRPALSPPPAAGLLDVHPGTPLASVTPNVSNPGQPGVPVVQGVAREQDQADLRSPVVSLETLQPDREAPARLPHPSSPRP